MPNRYEREIEEILRNMEQPAPGSGRSRYHERTTRKRPGVRMPQFRFSLNLSFTERLLLTAVIAALIAGGYAYLTQTRDLFTLILAALSIICLVLVACSHFLFQGHRPTYSRYSNIPPNVKITPLRRNPLDGLKTQWNLFKLRMRYRRKK